MLRAGQQCGTSQMQSATGFGLDIAGYSGGKSVLAAAVPDGSHCRVTLLRNSPFSVKRPGASALKPTADCETAALRTLIGIGPVFIDAPLDLQNLLKPHDARFIWELTLRPIDRVLGGLPALADKIGAPVARLVNLFHTANLFGEIGSRLFETYPAASLAALGLQAMGYKGTANGSSQRAIADALGMTGIIRSDDDLDAAICAITAVAAPAHQLRGKTLDGYLSHRSAGAWRNGDAPAGYVLLGQRPFQTITVEEADFTTWLAAMAQARPAGH